MAALKWEIGTAFDLFVSLHVLTNPGRYGLRPTWAAGVRARLVLEDRIFLERVQPFMMVPVAWLMGLQASPKTSVAALETLAALPAEKRLAALTITQAMPEDVQTVLQETVYRPDWTTGEQALVRAYYRKRNPLLKTNQWSDLMHAWRDPAQFGERYLTALQHYYSLFFLENEAHIRQAQEAGLAAAQLLAEELSLQRLLETLSQGVQFSDYLHDEQGQLKDIVLAPSYWSSPLVFVNRIDQQCVGLIFGCRGVTESLVPGEAVPPVLLTRLKALADPTRLRILRYLAEEPLTPSQLAAKLRLRPPTVTHHLNQLRLAGLVQIILLGEDRRRYAFRNAGIDDTLHSLWGFILEEKELKK